MAKPFYSMDEVCKLLGKSADDVKGMVRDGSLREFRDAGKVFFKAEDVDTLAGKSKSDTGMVLEPVGDEAPSARDAGASDSIALEAVDDDDESGDKKGDTVITASGISVFDDDELEIDADPMAKTAISSALGDEIPLDGSGSGSGLLDLTREADDTSLGAELLDEIYPGEDDAAAQDEPAAAEPVVEDDESADEGLDDAQAEEQVLAPVISAAAADPSEPIFNGLMIGALISLAIGASVVGGVLQGFTPGFALTLSNKFMIFAGGSVGVVALTTVLGWVVGKASSPKRG